MTYRTSYRAEERIRPLTESEETHVRREHARFRAANDPPKQSSLHAFFFGRVKQRAPKNPWEPPFAESWQAREIVIAARGVTSAASDDEDYALFLLFEIPGGDWFYVSTSVLPEGFEPDHAEVRLVMLHPDGPPISAEAKGERIPYRGARDDAEEEGRGYAENVERGYVWRPDDDDVWEVGPLPAKRVPEWARKLAAN